MEHVTKFRGKTAQKQIPLIGKTVSASTLLQKGEAKNAAAVFVRFREQVYLVAMNAQVPAESVIERDDKGQVCGIPAVTGG